MNYELALKLKEAGFSQKLIAGSSAVFIPGEKQRVEIITEISVKGLIEMRETGKSYPNSLEGYVKVPTLSELIEACGDGKSIVIMGPNTVDVGEMYWGPGEGWHAYYQTRNSDASGHGSTPEEAMTNLWLELNKQNGNKI